MQWDRNGNPAGFRKERLHSERRNAKLFPEYYTQKAAGFRPAVLAGSRRNETVPAVFFLNLASGITGKQEAEHGSIVHG